jgi:ribosomal protein L37E
MSNRKHEYRFEKNMPRINRPLAFPELARGRPFAQPFNIKVKPLRPGRCGIESYNPLKKRCSHWDFLQLFQLRSLRCASPSSFRVWSDGDRCDDEPIGCVSCKLQNGISTRRQITTQAIFRHEKSPEAFADQFGIRTALLVLCIASFIAAIWFVSRPTFEKCAAIENVTDRNACYDGLRKELLKPPAKGADIPKG